MDDLTRLAVLAEQHASSYASPHHFVLSVAGLRSIIAAVAAQPEAGEAVAWKRVPVEPTVQMAQALIDYKGDDEMQWPSNVSPNYALAAYRIMLASAPTIQPTQPVQERDDLRQRLQRQCSDWGTYWRAPDSHGVELTMDQATELLQNALGVEVEIKPNGEVCSSCDGKGMIGGPSFYAPDEGGVPCPDCTPAQAGDAGEPSDGERLDAEDIATLVQIDQDFDDAEETSVDYDELMRFARMGYLECTHFTVTSTGRAAIRATKGGKL